MTYRTFKTFIATFAILGTGVSAIGASAQDAAAPGAATPAAPAVNEETTQQHAVQNIQLLYAALNSDQISQEVKNALMGCIYQNSMRDITVAMDRAIDADTTNVDRSDNSQMLGVMASICGYKPSAANAQPSEGR